VTPDGTSTNSEATTMSNPMRVSPSLPPSNEKPVPESGAIGVMRAPGVISPATSSVGVGVSPGAGVVGVFDALGATTVLPAGWVADATEVKVAELVAVAVAVAVLVGDEPEAGVTGVFVAVGVLVGVLAVLPLVVLLGTGVFVAVGVLVAVAVFVDVLVAVLVAVFVAGA
jgi:hypothetical protein